MPRQPTVDTPEEQASSARRRLIARVQDLQHVLCLPPVKSADLYTQMNDLLDTLERELDGVSMEALKYDGVCMAIASQTGSQFLASKLVYDMRQRGRVLLEAHNRRVREQQKTGNKATISFDDAVRRMTKAAAKSGAEVYEFDSHGERRIS